MTGQEGDPHLLEEGHHEDVEKHPLLVWTSIRPGDVVSLRVPGTGDYVGIVESSTNDGLVIWMRDCLNERRLFHFRGIMS
jgi:uncharacterized protein YijF (DUF1287 family)